VRHGGVEALLGPVQAGVEARRHVTHVVVEGLEVVLEARGVGDEIGLSVLAEHRALVGARPPQPDRRRDGHRQREQRDGTGAECDQSRGGGQVGHGAEDTRAIR
jgi:hypothetical protein